MAKRELSTTLRKLKVRSIRSFCDVIVFFNEDRRRVRKIRVWRIASFTIGITIRMTSCSKQRIQLIVFHINHHFPSWKKREKRRWLFHKPTTVQENAQPPPPKIANCTEPGDNSDQNHAIPAAKEAMEVARLSRPPAKEHRAATIIQTAFRGYMLLPPYRTAYSR